MVEYDPLAGITFHQEERTFSPLRQVKGLVQSIRVEKTEGYNNPSINFDLVDIDPATLEATETYDFPTANIRVGYNPNRGDNRWTHLASSAEGLLTEGGDIKDLIGRRVMFKMVEKQIYDVRAGSLVNRLCWTIVAVSGGGAEEPKRKDGLLMALKLLDGKNIQQFHSTTFADAGIRSDPIFQNIMDANFLPALLADGIVTVDEFGVYHVKEG